MHLASEDFSINFILLDEVVMGPKKKKVKEGILNRIPENSGVIKLLPTICK